MAKLTITQIIPGKLCLSCDVCCRFIDRNASLAPLFLSAEITTKIKPYLDKSGRIKLKPFRDMHTCAFFNTKNNRCSVYSKRPFDCRLYPFTIMLDERHEKIVLGIDKKCPFSVNAGNEALIKNYFHHLADLLEKKEIASMIAENPSFIGGFQDDVIKLSYLDTLAKLIINNPEKNGFKQISLKDKAEFDNLFKNIENPDSSQNFVNLYIWKDKNPVWWKKKDKGLGMLLETDSGYIDFDSLKKFPDYVYFREDISGLKGNKYKHKRASCNYFSKIINFNICLTDKI